MKKIVSMALATIFVLSITTPAQAADPFFLNKKGAEVEHAIKDAKGNVTSYSKSVVTEINSIDAQNFTVTYTGEVFDKNHKSLMAPIKGTVNVKNGATEIAVGIMDGTEIEGTLPIFPADLSVGQVMKYSYSIKVMGIKTTTSGTNTVAAKESVTTPAGTFNCFKIEGSVSTKVIMSTTRIKTVSWMAPGIGAVKTETYDGKGKLQSIQELVSKK